MTHPARELAFRKIDARLRAYGLNQLFIRYQVAEAIVQKADAIQSEEDLDANACRVFNEQQDDILKAVMINSGLVNNAHGQAQATLILQQANLSAIWAAAMRSTEDLQAAIAAYAQAPVIITGPSLTRSTLGAPQLNFDALDETTSSTMAMINRWPKLRFIGFLSILAAITAFIVSTAR